jgi:hypothetical protein
MEDIGAEAVAFWIVLTALVGCAAVLARAGWERWQEAKRRRGWMEKLGTIPRFKDVENLIIHSEKGMVWHKDRYEEWVRFYGAENYLLWMAWDSVSWPFPTR